MPATEKDLAQDAPWKKIQQNTFTRWCNEHLKCVHKQVTDLNTDLSDGLRFIALLEVLSQKKMPRKHNARPIIRQMQLENVSVGLEFLEREHIRLVSIDSQAIVDGNLKLILGLIWTLILHYSISVPEWEDEEDTSKKQTPKQRLFGWIQNKLPDIPVRNFSKDWQNGRTLGALVDSCAPGLCPDWETWSEEKPVDNAREAMQQADQWLGVPQVITPEEIVDPNVDEYSVMTYLSQFPKAKLKPGAPLRPKLNPKKARAYGPGVEPSGNVATQPTTFVVETVRAGQGDLSISVKGPTGEDDEVKVTANNDKNHTYAVEYTPKAVGPHEVMVLFANQHISKSPFHVMVSEPQGDANKVSAAGPGLVSAGVVAGRPTDFNINTTGAGVGDVAVVVKGPKDQPTLVDAALEERGPGMYRCCYKPTMEGPHTVAVSFGGLPIPHSPYTVNVAPASKAIACRATGRGLQAKGVRINEIADFTVLTEGAGSGDLQVTLKKPSGVEEPIKQKTVHDTLHACEYKPTAVGKHTVSVTWAGQHTPGSPFSVDVGPEAGKQKVRAWGPGLNSGMVGKSSDFVVEALGTDVGALGFSIEGPSQCTIDCTDVGDGSCDVKYWPTQPGCYGIHVICDDDEIKNSPFIAEIVPVNTAFHPEKVRISGKGVEPTGNVVGQPLEFTVDAKDAGKAPLQAFAQDVDGTPVPVKVVDNGDGTYTCRYTPQKPIKHTVVVTWGALNVPSSPFRVKVGKGSYPQRVKVSGQGVERTGVKAHEPTSFTVDCSEAGEGDVSVGIKCASGVLGPCEADIDFDIIKNDDDTFLVKYTPLAAGRYTIMVLFADEELPNSPYRIKVDPSHDVHKVKAEGPGVSKTGVQLNQPTQFTVTTKGAGQAKLDVQFTGSTKGNPVRNMSIKDNKDDTHTVAYTPIQQGPMAVAVTYGGDLVPYSPFTVDVAPPVDLGKIQVQGLENKLVVGEEFEFDVNTRGAGGRGKLDVHVVSPSNKPLDCSVESVHTGNGSTVRFLPKEEGPHRVSMVYDGQLLDDTFTLEAALPPDPQKVRVSGEGLRSGKVGHPAQFSIDTRQGGQGNLSLTVEGPSEAKLECVDNGDGTCSVSYLPVEAGDYLINILFAGIHVPGSPFQATIEPSFDPKKVLMKGEGLKNVKVGDTGSFTLDCSQAGDANLDVKMVSDSGVEADVVTRRQAEGVYAVNYTPVCHGPHTMNVKYGGQSVPTFPACLEVQPSVDTSDIKVFGPGIEKAFCDATTDFSVDASSLTRTGGDDLTASITGPSGVVIDAAVTDKKNGTYVVEYTPFELGKHLVDVMYKEVPVAGSPFPLVVSEGCDPKRVCVSGPGLKSGWTNQTNSFTVETRGAGTGGLGLLIEGPTEAVISCTDNKNGTCLVEYVPQDPGQYEVLVSYGGQPVPGSPFVVPVQDKVNPSKVKVSGTGVEPGVRAGIPQEFVVDASRAGQAPLKVELINPRGKAEPMQVKDLGGGLHQVNYVAREEGPHGVRILYAGEVVSHSADKLKVLPSCDASKVRANGPGLASADITASLPVEFFIDTQDAGQENISVIVTDPDGKPRPTKLVSNGDGTYTVSYLPDRAGCYTVEVKYGDDDIPCSPYTVNAIPTGNAKKCKVHGLGSYIPIGHKTTISVNAQGAGAGKVTCCVCTPDGREVELDVLENADGTFDIVYAAPLPGAYTVDIRYGGELVPHSPFHVEALAQVIQEDIPVQECVQEVHHVQPSLAAPQPGDLRPFNLVVPFVVRRGEITGEVRMPSGQKDKPSIVTNQDGTVSVQYAPVEKGLHEMDIKCDREHIPGSPLQFYVDEVGSGNVTAYGPGLSHGVINKPACFTIDTKDATEGGLSLAVEGPSEAEILCEDHKDGTCTVSYLPTAPGLYKILVKFDDEHIPGSPFLARIADDGRRRTRLSVGSTQDVPLQLRETDLSLLEASIKGPSGGKVPCQLKRLSNGHVGISFTPCEVGDHEVSVLKDGSHVSNSPFIVTVGESEIGDATKVRVSGSGLHEGRTGELSNFLVDTTQAGYGGLSLAIEGPSKADLDCEEIENGTCRVTYCPMEPGNYLLNIKFADVHVAESPFTVKVTGEGRLQRQSITRRSQTPSVTSVGSLCDLSLKIPVMDASELKAEVVTPSEKTIPAEVVQGVSDGTFCIRFVPEEMGVHTVSVKHHGTHVQGSPFQFTVGPLGEGGAHKVRAAGSGLERAEAGVPAEFTIWSREAGAGGLSIAVEGPHKADISFDDHQDGSCTVSYIVQEAGEYEVSIRFNDEHIPDSPFMVPVTATSDAARLLTVTRLEGTDLKANHPASFSIDLNGAHGHLDAKVHAPSGTVTDCRISEVEKDKYAIRFLPHENGLHNVHVKLDGSHIPGSPFKLRVGEPGLAADPGLVSAFGPGLNTGVTGCPSEFEVKTARGSGVGPLSITIDGPSKVQMDCKDTAEGYHVTYTPMAPGIYLIAVKYGGPYHIPGSPFKAKITGPRLAGGPGLQESSSFVVESRPHSIKECSDGVDPQFSSDASKVVSRGQGRDHATLSQSNVFQVDCSKAGSNLLLVGMRGPTWPCDEVVAKHVGNNNYTVSYTVSERGDYILVVKWGEDHIPGSPFHVVVV